MKTIKELSLKLAGLLSLIGLSTACGDLNQAKVQATTTSSISKQLEQMGRLTREHSSTQAEAGGSSRGGGGGVF